MSETLGKYADLINSQTYILIHSDLVFLSDEEIHAIEKIQQYTKELMIFLITHQQTHPHLSTKALRHEIIDTLTPIVGYSNMLVDGQSDCPKDNRYYHFHLINQCVNGLKQQLLSQTQHISLTASA